MSVSIADVSHSGDVVVLIKGRLCSPLPPLAGNSGAYRSKQGLHWDSFDSFSNGRIHLVEIYLVCIVYLLLSI